ANTLAEQASRPKSQQREQFIGARNDSVLINKKKRRSDQVSKRSWKRSMEQQDGESRDGKATPHITHCPVWQMKPVNCDPEDTMPKARMAFVPQFAEDEFEPR